MVNHKWARGLADSIDGIDQIDEMNQIDQIDEKNQIDETDLPRLLTRGGTQMFDCPTVKNSPMLAPIRQKK